MLIGAIVLAETQRNEDVIAGYIQNTFEWDKGVVVAGVRYEHTSMDLVHLTQDTNPTFADNDYGFPAILVLQ